MTLGSYNRHDVLLTADMPISDTLLTTVSVSSQTREGYQKVIPYPGDSIIGSTPHQVSGQDDYPKAPGTQSNSAGGGENVQALRFKMLWHANDKVDLTFAGDYTHEDQSGLHGNRTDGRPIDRFIRSARLFSGRQARAGTRTGALY